MHLLRQHCVQVNKYTYKYMMRLRSQKVCPLYFKETEYILYFIMSLIFFGISDTQYYQRPHILRNKKINLKHFFLFISFPVLSLLFYLFPFILNFLPSSCILYLFCDVALLSSCLPYTEVMRLLSSKYRCG